MPVTKMRRINLDLSSIQYEEMTKLMAEKGLRLSHFIREAVNEYIAKIKREELEEKLKQGYLAKSKLNIETCKEFEPIDRENL